MASKYIKFFKSLIEEEYYDYESLTYRKRPNKIKYFLMLIFYVFGMFVMSIFLLTIYLNTPGLETPKEKDMKNKLNKLNYQLDKIDSIVEDIKRRDNKIYRVHFEVDSMVGENNVISNYNNYKGFISTEKRFEQFRIKIALQSKSLKEIERLASKKEKFFASVPAIRPVKSDINSSGYGMRIHPIYKIRKMHTGMDFSLPVGTPIFSTGDARVIKTIFQRGGYGNYIILDHGFGYKTLYAHMSEISVRVGQKVKRGQNIGYSGNTGISTGPHLHYEVIKNGVAINPINYYQNDLSPEEYEKIINNSALKNQSLD